MLWDRVVSQVRSSLGIMVSPPSVTVDQYVSLCEIQDVENEAKLSMVMPEGMLLFPAVP